MTMSEQTVQQQYDQWAWIYDRFWRSYVEGTTEALWQAARLQPEERVLDVGCGTGAFAQRAVAAHPAQPVVGVDLSNGMIRVARMRLRDAPNVRFTRASATALPFEEAAFDVVVSASALHYVARPQEALHEMARVLRPGGRVVLLDWCRDDAIMRLMDGFLRYVDPAHQRTLAAGELRTMLQEAGLAPRSIRRFRQGWMWGLMTAVAHRTPR